MAVLQENAMLGPYRIAGMIGEGGMGAVYRAEDTRLGRHVAIKILTNVTLSDRERLVRFEQEARATGMLNHPNLLTIFDVGAAQGTPYLVSELLQGETLRDRLNKGAIPVRKTVEIALAVAQGLGAAHEKGIVHRDLKPENIFLTRDHRVKILDFGIAKLSALASGENAFKPAATEPGMVMGTVGYMSPEQVRGENVDPRSDIFALGVIIYEMLSGQRAFKRGSSIETLGAILKEEPPELLAISTGIPTSLDRLVRRCLEKDREQRFQSARDLAFNLETMTNFSTPGTLSGVAQPQTPTAGTATVRTPSPKTAANPTATLPKKTLGHPSAVLGPHSAVTPAPVQQPRTEERGPRTHAHTQAKPKPKVSPVLLLILYIVSVAGAAWGGWYIAHKLTESKPDITYRRLTFRRGEVRSARFSPDGDTVVYSAAWEGQPAEIFIANRQSPEARPLGIADAEVLAVSKSAELAILLRRDRLTNRGTLARVPIAGGMPREIANDVLQADFSPDGSQMAIIRVANNKYRVEYPIGTVKYETVHDIRDLRVSPDGSRVAFIDPHSGTNDIVVVGSGSPEAIARGWSHGATGLAWAADGNEIWITGTDTGAPPSLYAVPFNAEPRLVNRVTGSMKLFDISSAGRLLIGNGTWRAGLLYHGPSDTSERDVSWLDWSILADLSQDGRSVLFNETREGGGRSSAIYLRTMDKPAPIHIGEGYADALSPDGKWILAHSGSKLMLLPTGPGESREIKLAGNFDLGARWLPDSRKVIVGGALPKSSYRLMLIDPFDESVLPLSPENIWGSTGIRPFALSPDGRSVAGMTADETIALYPLEGGAGTAVRGVEKGEVPIEFTPDGSAIYVYRPTVVPARVYKVTLATGDRELWKEFASADPAGVYKIAPVFMTRDASAYVYNALRSTSDLYVAEGLR